MRKKGLPPTPGQSEEEEESSEEEEESEESEESSEEEEERVPVVRNTQGGATRGGRA